MALDPITAGLEIGGKLIDRLWPNAAEAEVQKLELAKMAMDGELAKLMAETDLVRAQLEINAAEAGHSSLFVAGARPAVIWVCVGGMAWQFIVGPIAVFIADWTGKSCSLPPFDTYALMTILGSLLGFGTLRTVEKIKGVNTARVG